MKTISFIVLSFLTLCMVMWTPDLSATQNIGKKSVEIADRGGHHRGHYHNRWDGGWRSGWRGSYYNSYPYYYYNTYPYYYNNSYYYDPYYYNRGSGVYFRFGF
ncbi:MAG: hypothetical protein ACK5MA_08150 [Parachlamydiaceae bacterium]